MVLTSYPIFSERGWTTYQEAQLYLRCFISIHFTLSNFLISVGYESYAFVYLLMPVIDSSSFLRVVHMTRIDLTLELTQKHNRVSAMMPIEILACRRQMSYRMSGHMSRMSNVMSGQRNNTSKNKQLKVNCRKEITQGIC